ncbi:hypothetical protein [Enterococcus faecium]|uniref:hypothetical protein n=1 Tax=Enterococcus faecium TaxID=1352 RepID=UPI0003A0152C|nr:hypothetical protein [Enterococcus faecium]
MNTLANNLAAGPVATIYDMSRKHSPTLKGSSDIIADMIRSTLVLMALLTNQTKR